MPHTRTTGAPASDRVLHHSTAVWLVTENREGGGTELRIHGLFLQPSLRCSLLEYKLEYV